MCAIEIDIEINGKNHHLSVHPHDRLVTVLREQVGLTGTKNGCGVGECGACTVLLDGNPVNSCLVFAAQAHNHKVLTIEGLSEDSHWHPLQQAFVDLTAIQCGYCTPGMLMSAAALLDRNNNPSEDQIRQALVGNICRCTGYSKIVAAIQQAAKEMQHG